MEISQINTDHLPPTQMFLGVQCNASVQEARGRELSGNPGVDRLRGYKVLNPPPDTGESRYIAFFSDASSLMSLAMAGSIVLQSTSKEFSWTSLENRNHCFYKDESIGLSSPCQF